MRTPRAAAVSRAEGVTMLPSGMRRSPVGGMSEAVTTRFIGARATTIVMGIAGRGLWGTTWGTTGEACCAECSEMGLGSFGKLALAELGEGLVDTEPVRRGGFSFVMCEFLNWDRRSE